MIGRRRQGYARLQKLRHFTPDRRCFIGPLTRCNGSKAVYILDATIMDMDT